MSKTLPAAPFLRATLYQLLAALLLAPILYVWLGAASTASLLSGAACAVIPHLYFAVWMSRAAKQGAQRAARLGLAAEGGKFLLSALAFAVVFAVVKPERPGLVFLGFGFFWLVQFVQGIRLLLWTQR